MSAPIFKLFGDGYGLQLNTEEQDGVDAMVESSKAVTSINSPSEELQVLVVKNNVEKLRRKCWHAQMAFEEQIRKETAKYSDLMTTIIQPLRDEERRLTELIENSQF